MLGDTPHPSVEGFWAFVEEREAVRTRREKWPDNPENWTLDPTLLRFHFCNVRRADDYGTKWYMERIGKRGRSDNNATLLWQTCVYRLVNNVLWFERLQPKGFITPAFTEKNGWRKRIEVAGTPSNKAYRNLTSSVNPSWSRNHRLRDYLAKTTKSTWLASFNNSVLDGGDIIEPEELWKRLQAFPGIGAFAGLQVYRDLMLVPNLLPFDEDDWTYIGPGADEGVKLLMIAEGRNSAAGSYRERYSWLQNLRKDKRNVLNLSLGDVEHCMCEYVKWCKFREGNGKMRRYEPRAIV